MSIPFGKIFLGIYLTGITTSDTLQGMGRENVLAFKCDRCGHVWLPRDNVDKLAELDKHLPKVCPKCKSPYWNIPRKGV